MKKTWQTWDMDRMSLQYIQYMKKKKGTRCGDVPWICRHAMSSGAVHTTLPSLEFFSRSQRPERVTGTVNDGGGDLTSSSVA
jgi:hypothetical protein